MDGKIAFTENEYSFIEEKFGISKEAVDAFSEEEYFELQDKCSDIEVNAIMEAGNDELSDDGNTASAIITKIGDTLCGEDGEDDED